MKYSISTCSFYKLMLRKLLNIPQHFGVEIFYEYGSTDMWESFLTELTAHGHNGFSIHAPFAFVDISADCNETKLFDTLRRPFDLYHKYDGEFYVLHTYGGLASRNTEQERAACLERSFERMYKFNEICKAEGVRLGAENLCDGNPPLYSEERFLQLFRDIPDLNCVLDIGHALVTKLDIAKVQRELGSRICAYHLHNNDGVSDSHERLRLGVMDWETFAQNCKKYTPDAVGVLEYLKYQNLDDYEEDRIYLESFMN